MSGTRLTHCSIRPCRSVPSCAPGPFLARPLPTSTQGAMLHHPHPEDRRAAAPRRHRTCRKPASGWTTTRSLNRVAQPASEDKAKAARRGAAAGPARSRRQHGASTPVSLRRWQLRLPCVLSAQQFRRLLLGALSSLLGLRHDITSFTHQVRIDRYGVAFADGRCHRTAPFAGWAPGRAAAVFREPFISRAR